MSHTEQNQSRGVDEDVSPKTSPKKEEPVKKGEVDLSLSSERAIPITSKPGLVPLFALCFLVMAVGFYFALQRSGQASSLTSAVDEGEDTGRWSQMAERATFATLATQQVHPPEQPVVFPPLEMSQPRIYAYTMVQTLDAMTSGEQSPGERDVRTLLNFRVDVAPISQNRERRVSFTDISLKILSDRDPFASRLTDQLANRLEGSAFQMLLHRTGVPERVIWDDGAHLKLEPLLKLMESGVMSLSISLPTRPVLAQEQWNYMLPLTGLEVEGVDLDGKLLVEASLRGNTAIDQTGAQLIAQKFELKAQGTMPVDLDGVLTKMSYQLEGEGEGALLFDSDRGVVTSQEMTLTLELTLTSASPQKESTRASTLLMKRTLVEP